jgi:hypothetical protein
MHCATIACKYFQVIVVVFLGVYATSNDYDSPDGEVKGIFVEDSSSDISMLELEITDSYSDISLTYNSIHKGWM